jgi:hypothetical protein
MNQTTIFDPAREETPTEIAAIKTEIERCRIEWEQIKKRLLEDKEETQKLRSETRANLNRLQEQIDNL